MFVFQNSMHEWRVVWFVIAGMFIVASVVFLVFGDASLQPWAQGQTEIGQGCKHGSPNGLEMTVHVFDGKTAEAVIADLPQSKPVFEKTRATNPTNTLHLHGNNDYAANGSCQPMLASKTTQHERQIGQTYLVATLTSGSMNLGATINREVAISKQNCYTENTFTCLKHILNQRMNFEVEVLSEQL